MELSLFDYSLPKDLIAQSPIEKRDSSRLMVLDDSNVLHDSFDNLPNYLVDGDVLVLNDSRVVKCKFSGRKRTGGRVELLLLGMDGDSGVCLIRGKKIRVGTQIKIEDVTCEVTEKIGRGFKLRFDQPLNKVMNRYGEVPLPYYIKEHLLETERYQTVYSKKEGSIAAPTAGLHFTEDLLGKIKEKGVKISFVTLHIGPSTFLPINNRDATEQNLTPEYYSIDQKNAELINKGIKNDSVIAIGTTSVKALESAPRDGRISAQEGLSQVFITPGYDFKIPLKGMITNFHLPKSSLLLLVCALFGRERILSAYHEAISKKYRFYSFGDAMYIKR